MFDSIAPAFLDRDDVGKHSAIARAEGCEVCPCLTKRDVIGA